MSEELELSKPLHERVYERIRDSIGDLMTDEDLKILVDKATHKAFFEPVPSEKWNGYGTRPTDPPIIVTKIEKLLDERVTEAAKAWVKEHPEEVSKIIDEQISKGFTKIITDSIDRQMQNALSVFAESMRTQLGINRY